MDEHGSQISHYDEDSAASEQYRQAEVQRSGRGLA